MICDCFRFVKDFADIHKVSSDLLTKWMHIAHFLRNLVFC